MLIRLTLVASLLVVSLGLSALAQDYKLGNLHIDQVWARASAGPVKNGATYLTITSQGAESDRLVSVETEVAKRAELHTHVMQDDVMKMRPIEAIEVAAGEPTELRPGGLHIMLMGLKAPLVEGESFPLLLTFERAGSIEVEVRIKGPGAMGHDGGMQHDHGSSN